MDEMRDFVVFKNPHLRYRKEEFGGIAKLQVNTLILNKKQYELINNLKKISVYSSFSDYDKKIVDKLIENNILLKVNLNKAKELGFKN